MVMIMAREIKFRGWLVKEKRMLNIQKLILGADWIIEEPNGKLHDTFKNSDAILLRYTGLKDKNGVEIYEGDIVHVVETYSGDHRIAAGNRAVYFEEGAFDVSHFGDGLAHYSLNGYCEVIGNIYKNPDLLK